METGILVVVTSAMVLSILTSTGLFVGSSFAQENMTSSTNETGAMMGNQTESGTASGIENLTGGSSGNIGLLQNDTAIGSQNTSVTGGMEQEQNETGGMMGNETNQTGQGGGNQTQQGPLEQLGEALGGIFGGGNQSQ
jgi:hypothetical protein